MDISEQKVSVEFIYTPVANYAIQQNRIPIVRKLVIENTSKEDYTDIEISIKSCPEFTSTWNKRVDLLPKEQSLEIDVKGFSLSPGFLFEITEKLAGELLLLISSAGKVLFSQTYNVDLLAYDQWNGVGALPEMLAAFVTPNHPEISKIIQKASVTLETWTGNPSFNAYQSKSTDRVKKQLGAIFEAVASLGIVYCTPPASFERSGQRIRMGDTILSQKLSTCVDTAILYASCIEAVGLNPLLIVINGHAFAGAWLIDETFADSVNYDCSLLKKRTAKGINEILLVEATCMNAGMTQSFDEAVNIADFKVVNEEEFILFVDVARARLSGIRPLPQKIKTSDGWEVQAELEHRDRESQVPEDIIIDKSAKEKEASQLTKQKLWERKLLDLSLRNNLLNLRITQSTIQLLSVSLNTFEDALANGDEFQVLPKPEEWVNTNVKSGVYQTINKSDPIVDLLKHEISRKRLRTYLTESELKSGIVKLYRASRLSLEENGANTLYLALGFLKWYETSQSELPRYAPILLLPVEIIRKSAQIGYVIRSREEETIMNVTLLEMLKQDYGIIIRGLDELPKDESGVDVNKIFSIIRRAIMPQPRWDLEEHAFLGIFSFSKFIMWNDINKNAEKLKENKVVASLISGKLEWDGAEIEVNDELDDKYHPSEILLPISGDSSQLEAICASVEDKSFILHGPPGTGKSQTITNIIANALYKGKKVLFVAEKMAALSVVQKRLKDIGIGPFCLELHSNKAKKSSVLEQLQKITEISKSSSPLEFKTEAERLHKQRLELNQYVQTLHKKYSFGFSLFDSFTGYSEITGAPDNVQFERSFIDGLSKEDFIDYCNLVEELQNAGSLCGHPHNHPLNEVHLANYTQQIKTQAQNLLEKYIETLNEVVLSRKRLCELLGVEKITFNNEKTVKLTELAELILSLPDTPEQLIVNEFPERLFANITKLANHGIKRDDYKTELSGSFTAEILKVNAELKLSEWNNASQKWFIPKFFGQRKILKSLQLLSKGAIISKDEVTKHLEKVILFQQEQGAVDNNLLSKELDFLWNEGNADWQTVIKICNILLQIHLVSVSLTEDPLKAKNVKTHIASQLSPGSRTFLETKGKTLTGFVKNVNQLNEIEKELSDTLKIYFNKEADSSSDYIEEWMKKAQKWLININSLKDWVSWNHIKEKVINSSLRTIVDSYESGNLKNEEVVLSFKKSLYKHFAEYIIANEPGVSIFNGKLFEAKIEKFKEQSKYFEELTKKELAATMASKIPAFTREASNNSEIGILQRALRNGGRGISIRKLFDSIPNLLPRLCPCMLMSPISVAQYFEVDKTKFALVVFDEASQMPTSEAIGAVARGQNVIVVGDPKQMPPTSFFSTNQFDEDNAEKEDLESILDDCLALSIPSKHLLWHYRSKHESLIAFSNSHFYENKLMTFPSPDDLSSKVSNVFVPGHYDRGKTRQNIFEARAIVAEVISRIADPVQSKRSIGIVTFSAVQQNLIDDLLNEEFKNNPDLEKVAMEAEEPIFIKNLENVQGDERDVILFSVCYAPDKEGKVYLNFGPLIRKGGWRRLNVAVSRARYEMKVFSTLRSDQIDISRSSSDEIAGFKAFLAYTEKGKRVIQQKNIVKRSNGVSFANMIAEEIRRYGYKANTDIGCSGYRIDIGIVHPENESEYILGILTDGENYYTSKTAKDREIIQSNVLRMLGWNIYRLWSVDWWENPEKVIRDIIQSIRETLVAEKNNTDTKSNINYQAKPESQNKELVGIEITESSEITKIPDNDYLVYNVCELDKHILNNSDEFFYPHLKPRVINQINKVLEIEAPISHELLSRKILNAWGISRLGPRLNDHLTSIYGQLKLKKSRQSGSYFYWRIDQDPENYKVFRIAAREDQKRNVEDIPKEEIVNGIKKVLTMQFSLPKDDLIKEAARIFGYTRTGGNVEEMMKLGIDYALEKKVIEKQNDRFILKMT